MKHSDLTKAGNRHGEAGNPAGNDMTAIAIEIPKDAHDAWDCFKTVDAQVKLCTELQLLLVRGGVA